MLLMAMLAVVSGAVVNRPVVNMYSSSSTDADVVSQAIYGQSVDVVEDKGEWLRIRTPDDYTGWVLSAGLVRGRRYPEGASIQVGNLFAHIYREASVTKHAPLITVPFETRLEAQSQPGEDWMPVRLVDGNRGWIQRGDVPQAGPERATISETITLARRFLGLPYTWGGTSSFGYDCSGFMQMLERRRGYDMPRDAQPQADWSGLKAVSKELLEPGDLLYFGSSDRKITHTGMYIGNGEFIHATTHEKPVIQVSQLADPHWTHLLVACRRIQ